MANSKFYRQLKVGVIGCGNMGSSIVRGIAGSAIYPQNIHVADPDSKKLKALKKDHNIRLAKSNRQIATLCDVVILAIKPQIMEFILDEISQCTPKGTLVVSVAAGVPLAKLQKVFREKVPVIRVMPNIPAVLGVGVSAYSLGTFAGSKHKQIIEMLLKSIGTTVEVKEQLMNVVTAVSGSGPAYYFLLAEKMIEAAYGLGMKSQIAKRLVYQTALGSARIMLEESEDPDVLIQRVASKGGTTEAALKVLHRKGFGKLISDAISAAAKKSEELSKN